MERQSIEVLNKQSEKQFMDLIYWKQCKYGTIGTMEFWKLLIGKYTDRQRNHNQDAEHIMSNYATTYYLPEV